MQLKPIASFILTFFAFPSLALAAPAEDAPENDAPIDTVVVNADRFSDALMMRDDLDKVRGISNADVFSGNTSIQLNNMHNEAGAIDPGIRGLQGHGRVAMLIDGSLQSTHTSRGYQGVSDRTYIDTDLLSSLSVDKGATIGRSPYASGAIGGTITATTLNATDIVRDGEGFGAVVKLRAHNNARSPRVSGDATEQLRYRLADRSDHQGFDNGSAMIGLGYQSDGLGGVLAFSHRKKGNHFAGKKGIERYEEPVIGAGQEVGNTSFESDSWLAKLDKEFGNGHQADISYRHHRQEAGEVLMAYWYTDEREEGTVMPQWGLGTADVDAYSANYRYTSPSQSWLNLHANAWHTSAKLNQYNGLWAKGSNAEQYLHEYQNDRHGASIANRSEWSSVPVSVDYGVSYTKETLAPIGDTDRFYSKEPTSRHGKRSEWSVFANSEIDFSPVTAKLGVNWHEAQSLDKQTQQSLHYRGEWDLLGELHYDINASASVFAKLSRTARLPSLYEVTISNEVFSYNPYNPLDPEVSFNQEYGVSLDGRSWLQERGLAQTRRAAMTVSYFNNHVSDFISGGVLDRTPGMPSWRSNFTFTNYDELSLSGIELQAHYAYQGFYSHFSATFYDRVQVCSQYQAERSGMERCNSLGFAWGTTPTRIPPERKWHLNVGHKWLDDRLDIGTTVRYHSGKSNPADWLKGTGAASPVVAIASEYLVDIYSHYDITPDVSVFMTVNNLTDRYTIQPGSVVSMPDPGRTITLGTQWSF
ncbi:TonB-dependent receptor plug domain-containing protein [Salinivibrio proteolyticus]|uniref:TonB-dependent receptor n=1 Tax=Salinivibrio proteolyticus TaxID=334715 RepID=A0ABY7LE57_9GAMM|nr:TonB-dependent receptor plug domain-containing protein [Salinivibrio proteolyticus]WBA15527.1 TonB-dependent receptor [Salinivibrio proteolyticus]